MYTAEKKERSFCSYSGSLFCDIISIKFSLYLSLCTPTCLIASIIVSTHIRTKDHRLIIAQPAHRPITALASNSID